MYFLHVDRGFDITYKSSDDSSLQIIKYGEYLYDHIIVFAPATKGKSMTFCSRMEIFNDEFSEFGGRLDAEILTQFVDAGGNVLVAGSNTIGKFILFAQHFLDGNYFVLGETIREFAGECGIEFADDKSAVIDHLNYDVNDNGQVGNKISFSDQCEYEYIYF